MSNDFSNDDGVDEGICLENSSATEKISKPGLEKVPFVLGGFVSAFSAGD